MHQNRSIKWGLIAVLLIVALGVCAACTRSRTVPNSYTNNSGTTAYNTGTRVIEGYIVGFDRNNIIVDEVEFLTADNSTRIKELGLDTTKDFRNGYYIHNDGNRDRVTLPLASDVQVRVANTAYTGVYDGVGAGTSTVRDGMNTGAMVDGVRDGVGGVGYYAPNGVGDTPNVNVGNNYSNTNTGNTGLGAYGKTTVTHIGHTLGGVASGMLGGLELMTSRFANGYDGSGKTPYFITIQNGYVTGIEEVGAYSNFAGTSRASGVTR